MTSDNAQGAIAGQRLAELLRATREPLLSALGLQSLSRDYLKQSAFIIDEYARFCEQHEPAHPWLLRYEYLAQRAELRANQSFSASYLDSRTRRLAHFLRWYLARLEAGEAHWSDPSAEQLDAYWSVQPQAARYRHRILSFHLRPMLQWLQQRPPLRSTDEIEPLVSDYLRKHYLVVRGKGYGLVLTHRAKIVTRRHLVWLEPCSTETWPVR